MKVFPLHLFNPTTIKARIAMKTISGGVSLSGEEDVIVTDGGGRWEISFSGIGLDDPSLLRTWDAWLDHLDGGTVCLVPVPSLEIAPRPYLGLHPSDPSDIVADHPVFPTSVEFAEPYITAQAAGATVLRATQLAITVTRGAELSGGEKFSVGGRLHRVGENLGGNLWKIAPPTREPIASGAALNFDWPLLQCRMQPGDFSAPVEWGQFADGQITFVEAF